MKISIVINCDTRPQNDTANEMFKGVCNEDFLVEGVIQKQKFFDGFDIETIVYVDEHLGLPEKVANFLRQNTDTLAIRKHTHEHSFNDWNYIRALQLASGDYVCHFDQDTSAYTSNKEAVQELLDLLETYKYVSYPSHWSPKAVADDSFNYVWASTRFFICKRETLNFPEIIKCLTNYEYYCETYKPSKVCHWVEHFLGIISNSSVYYPKINLDKLAIWSWGRYEQYILQRLNNQTYDDVRKFVEMKGIQYPNDLFA